MCIRPEAGKTRKRIDCEDTAMTHGNMRGAAIHAICEVKPLGGTVDYATTDVREVYCEHVFNEAVQRERLPEAMFAALGRTVKAGEELDPGIAPK